MLEKGPVGQGKYVTFKVGESRLGVPLEWVCGIRESKTVFLDEQRCERVLFFGEQVPVIDLGEWLFKSTVGEAKSNLLIIGKGKELTAARIAGTGEMVETGALLKWPSFCKTLVEGSFVGVMSHQESLILVVDPESIVGEARRSGVEPAKEAEGDEL